MNRNRIVLLNLLLISTIFVAGLAASEIGVGTKLFFPIIHTTAPVSVTACKLEDSDGNLATSSDQSALPGWTIYLIVDGVRQEPGQTTVGDGCTTWENVGTANNVGVEEELVEGWTSLNGTSHDFGQAVPGSSHQHSFINAELPETMVEFRGLWVTRFDWASNAQPSKIDEIVADADAAGFNAIFFQIRGEADAYYDSDIEPWGRLLTGNFGQDPGWDPLAYMVQKAHERGIQVHAYLNVYPIWLGCDTPPDGTSPRHLYYLLRDHHLTENGKLRGLQWDKNSNVICNPPPASNYQRATPASGFFDDHVLAVASELVANYDIDGLHLDHIRYGGRSTSCDPVSQEASGVPCFTTPPNNYSSYEDWQRAQVNGTVSKFYDQIISKNPDLWLSAAVWPIYIDYWGWNGSQGYYDYYQDSKAWLAGKYIDSISPMIYPGTFSCPYNGFWTFSRWQTLVQDYQNSSAGRFIVPGIGTRYCTFDEIEARINAARSIGTAGHALFSYGGLKNNQYFDDLAAGPYAQPAVVPQISWHN